MKALIIKTLFVLVTLVLTIGLNPFYFRERLFRFGFDAKVSTLPVLIPFISGNDYFTVAMKCASAA